jgi:hypothetical protein
MKDEGGRVRFVRQDGFPDSAAPVFGFLTVKFIVGRSWIYSRRPEDTDGESVPVEFVPSDFF